VFCCGTAAEKAEDEIDAEDEEYEQLNMPSLRAVMNGRVSLCMIGLSCSVDGQ